MQRSILWPNDSHSLSPACLLQCQVVVEHIERAKEEMAKAADMEVIMRSAPFTPADANTVSGVEGSFDWIVDYPQLAKHLSCESLEISPSARILNVGCGTSRLSEHMYDAGFQNITNVDLDKATIEEMQRRHGETRAEMQWLVGDMTDTTDLFPAGECFEVALDKGTLDAMLCVDEASALFCEVARLLTVGGVFVVVSFRARELMEKLLTVPLAPFHIRCEKLDAPANSQIQAHVYLLRKAAALRGCPLEEPGARGGAEGRLDLARVKEFQDSVIEWWHREQAPMLTPATERDIARRFQAALHAGRHGQCERLPLLEVCPAPDVLNEFSRTRTRARAHARTHASVRAHTCMHP